MALVTRYFSTSSAGAADGTTWSDRAALFTTGNWSSVITGFAFNASDALECRIGPGSYTCSQTLASGLFSNPPTATNFLLMVGSDSSGNRLAIPSPSWVSAQAAFDDSTLPVIATTTNSATLNLAFTSFVLLKCTASGRNGAMVSAGQSFEWCVMTNSTANSAANAMTVTSGQSVTNCVASCTGSAYASVVSISSGSPMSNVRVVGNAGSSGNRDGIIFVGTGTRTILSRITCLSNGGRGFAYTGSTASVSLSILSSVFAGNAGDQILFPNTASQTSITEVMNCMITGGSAYGINPGGTNTNLLVTQCRLRDNTSNNFNTFGNYPTDLNNYTTDSDDATEYVNTATGDYRIKNTATIWGQGYGVADEAASGGGSNVFLMCME